MHVREKFVSDQVGRLESNPALRPWRRHIQVMSKQIEAFNKEKEFWRDCEIFFPLVALADSKNSTRNEYLIGILLLLLGLADIRDFYRRLPDGYYRLKNLTRVVYRVKKGKLSDVTDQVLFPMDGFRTDIYNPTSGLFSDMLSPTAYPHFKNRVARKKVASVVKKGIRTFQDYSLSLSTHFEDAISSVVLLPKESPAQCYNLGITYFGGIFVNPFAANPYSFAESMIHEYYHNCLWVLWHSVGFGRHTSLNAQIVSPFTGGKRPLFSMLDALFIYTAHYHFYRKIYYENPPRKKKLKDFVLSRVSHLHANIPVLYKNLKQAISDRTVIRNYLSFIMDFYSELNLKILW